MRPTIIPASTANKQKVKSEYEKENDQESAPENPRGKGLTRPPLVTRQSTRSAAIQQRIREYELVNEMLQAAMAAEDAGDETETENLTTEVEEAITHLKTNLEVPGEASTAEKPTILIGSTESTSILEGQLQESKVTIEKLGHEVEELRTQVAAAKIPVDWPGSSESTIESTSAAHTAEMKEIKKQHELEIASLRQKLQVLELSEQERAEQAALFSNHSKAVEALQNDLALERKAMKESADKVSLLVHEIEDRKAEIATANAKAEQHVKNIQAYQVQLASKDRELQGQGVVIRNLEEEVTALQQAKSAEAETLKQSFTKRVVELEEHIATLKSAADRSSEESAVSNAHVQEKMICQEKEISRLGQVIERLQDEIQKVHETKSNELDERLLQIRQEHDQTVEALKAEHQLSIDGLTSSHNTIVEKLDFEARNNRTAYEKQIQVLENERSEVQKRLKDTNNLLKTSQDEAEKRIHELESKHEKSLQAANESLATAEKALANSQQLLKQTKEDSERTVATTIKTLEDKVQALEGQAAGDAAAIKSSREDLAAAQEQVVSLKHTLMTMEKDSHSKEDHHAESLKKALDQAEMARKSLLERSKSPELAEKSHAEAIENLKSGHEAELEMVRSELSQKHENLFLDLKGKHDELLAAHANLERSQKHELERLKAEHDRALGDSSKMIADLQRAHFGELEEVRRQISDDHSRALKQLEEEFSKKVTDAEKMHKAALDDLRSSHEKTLLDLRAELEDSHLKSAETTKKSHEAIVKDLKICLEKQKTELAAAQSELRKTSDQARNPQLDVVRSQLHESTDALTAARSEISRLAHEVEAMKQRFEQGQKTIHELESAAKKISKARMDSSSQEVQALREQLDGALQEAETQRTNSDIANKELRERTEEAKQFQTRIEELEAKLYVGNKELFLDPKVTTPGSLRKRNRKRPKMMSPRLSQSEWTSEVADGGISGNPSPRTHGENLGSSIQGTVGISSHLLLLFYVGSS